MNLPPSLNRTLRAIVVTCLLLVSAFAHSELWAQAVLNPGQFTGRVQIGRKTILSGFFRATNTSPTCYIGESYLNGTYWDGSSFGSSLVPCRNRHSRATLIAAHGDSRFGCRLRPWSTIPPRNDRPTLWFRPERPRAAAGSGSTSPDRTSRPPRLFARRASLRATPAEGEER